MATKVKRELLPRANELNAVVRCIGIGTASRARSFCDELEFPSENLFADPDNACYDALQLRFGVLETFFSIHTPFAFKKRIEDDGMATLRELLPRWKPWLPPKQKQALNQGGCVVLEGRKRVLLMHRDRSTGDHVVFSEVFRAIETRSMGGTEDDDGRR